MAAGGLRRTVSHVRDPSSLGRARKSGLGHVPTPKPREMRLASLKPQGMGFHRKDRFYSRSTQESDSEPPNRNMSSTQCLATHARAATAPEPTLSCHCLTVQFLSLRETDASLCLLPWVWCESIPGPRPGLWSPPLPSHRAPITGHEAHLTNIS